MSDDDGEKEYEFIDVTMRVVVPVPSDMNPAHRTFRAEELVEKYMNGALLPNGHKQGFSFRETRDATCVFTESKDEFVARVEGEAEAAYEAQMQRDYERHLERRGW